MDHLAIPVGDHERSRRFYETYFGFDARPPAALLGRRPDALQRRRLRALRRLPPRRDGEAVDRAPVELRHRLTLPA
jgi:catechol 2,3-dioxygenase-like lactoylglutathione lyase family enzyme